MKATYYDAKSEVLLSPMADIWQKTAPETLEMVPAPVAMATDLSPFMATSRDHGKIKNVQVQILHNGRTLNVRLQWADENPDTEITDLDQFADGAAVMFPLAKDAHAITMGDADNPVNAWFWKADAAQPHDVVARGFGTSRRRPGAESGLLAASSYADGHWHVVFQRSLRPKSGLTDQVVFRPNASLGIAVALWEGSNRERAGQKSISGDWTTLEVAA